MILIPKQAMTSQALLFLCLLLDKSSRLALPKADKTCYHSRLFALIDI